MGTTIPLRNVVGEAVDILLEGIIPLHGHFHGNPVFAFAVEVEHPVDRCLVGVQMLNKGSQATFVFKDFVLARAFVGQTDSHATVQKCQLAKALGKDVVMEFDVGKSFRRRDEMHLGARGIGFTNRRKRRVGNTVSVSLLVDLVVATDGQGKGGGQCVHYRNPDAVQTTGHFVGVIVEFTTGVQHGHDNFCGGNAFLFMQIDRNSTAVILDRHRLVRVNNHTNLRAVARERFIDGVIHQLKDHVVQAGTIIGIPDVHAWPLSHRIQSFQDFDTGGIVVRFTHSETPEA